MFSFFKKAKETARPAPVVVPRIKHTNFLAAVDSIPGMTDASRPLTEPLVGDLLLTYAIDIGPSYLSVTAATLKDHNLQQDDLRALAQASGRQALKEIQFRTDGTIHELTAPENMAACSLLYPELWRQIEQEMGAPIAVAFPHRDFVLYAKADPAGIAALNDVMSQLDFDQTHALSRLLYRLSPSGWEVAAA